VAVTTGGGGPVDSRIAVMNPEQRVPQTGGVTLWVFALP